MAPQSLHVCYRGMSGHLDGAAIADFNSLIRRENSLFLKLFSLLTRLGKYLKSACSTAVFGPGTVAVTSETANFPVKFPVCREFV
jgi:hypothetical protein